MALKSGTRLGPYEVVGHLGAGGMGEVYRARDTRLGREVAIKVLPQHLAGSAEDRARLSREAKTISALNHPHICTLYDVGREGDTDYLVMELVEGETLARRLSKGPLPMADVLRIGAQIADALDRAHRAGITHRDLKPGNVMLTKSGAKLMDFGLARESRGGSAGAGPNSLTATEPGAGGASDDSITKKGTIVGTFQYMAPEQLEGKRADARSDIWALGCVLYEMATGKRAFEGTSSASVISAIMRGEPRAMTELEPLTPPAFEHVVTRCLDKDSDSRWQSAGDVCRELQWIAGGGGESAGMPLAARPHAVWERLVWLAIVVASVVVSLILRTRPTPESVVFELAPPPGMGQVDLPRISPDGKTLAFNATDSTNTSYIWVRRMNSIEARRLPGTEGARRPFWSPDSRSLAYFANGQLIKIDLSGGPPVKLADIPSAGDGTWSRHDVILFDRTKTDSIQSVSASGGVPKGAVLLDRSRGEIGAAWPQFLPDGRHFLYLAYRQDSDSAELKVGSIGTRKTKALGPISSRVEYASGHLLYVSGSALISRPFDPKRLEFTGLPDAIAAGVEADRGGGARFSTSSTGTLVFHTGAAPQIRRLVWLDRRGRRLGTVGPPGYYDMPSLSPDDRQLVVQVYDPTRSTSDLWLWDLGRNLGSRFTFTNRITLHAAWSSAGTRVVYGREYGAGFGIFAKATGASSPESLLYASSGALLNVSDWSRDGRWVLYMTGSSDNSNIDIYALPTTGSRSPGPIANTNAWEVHPMLSPDGKWLAYASNETGRYEVYVEPFQRPGVHVRVSTQGGIQPAWRGDGHEIFYLQLDGGLMSVTVEPGAILAFSSPSKLFDAPANVRFDTPNQYVPARDGQRFLFVAVENGETRGATTVRLDWPAMLGRE